MNRREEILSSIHDVPSMPSAALGAVGLLQDPEADMAELIGVIEHDPGLTANLLRIANSAYYGGAGTIDSLRQAIVRLGTKCILQMVVASAAAPLIIPEIKGYGLSPGDLWKHSIAVAVGTERLAEALGLPVPEYAFTAGLLHDVGKMVLGTFLEVDAGPSLELAQQEQVSFDVAEHRVLGIDHAEAGAALLERWQLPAEIVCVSRWHHDPNSLTGDTFVADLVHAADALCLMGGIGAGSDGLQYRPSRQVAERINLTTLAAETAVCGILEGLAELSELFNNGSGR